MTSSDRELELLTREAALQEAVNLNAQRLVDALEGWPCPVPMVAVESSQLRELLAALRRLRKQRLVEVA